MIDHGFLLVFNTHFLSNMHRFKVILAFVIVDYGTMSISTTTGRPRPEMTPTVDKATTDFNLCPTNVSVLLCTVHKLFAFFHWS
jgi:hypothetical protein